MNAPALTVSDLESFLDRDDWLGFGYLGGRESALQDSGDPECPPQPERVVLADQTILAHANAHGWTREQLFDWANSKLGRWFGDVFFGGWENPVQRVTVDGGSLMQLPS